jgi:hypothetical protein
MRSQCFFSCNSRCNFTLSIDGNIIRLGELGSLRLKLRSEGRDNKNDVDVSCIKDVCIVFTPGKRLKEMLKKIEYKKIQERKKKTNN